MIDHIMDGFPLLLDIFHEESGVLSSKKRQIRLSSACMPIFSGE